MSVLFMQVSVARCSCVHWCWCMHTVVVEVYAVIGETLTMDGNIGVQEVGSVREVFLYLCWGGQLECAVNGLLSYQGGSSDCVWLRQDMGYDDVVKVVEGTIEEGIQGRSLWYSTKYDRKMLLPLRRDADVGKLVKGNDEFGYMYIAESNGQIWKSMELSQVGGNGEGSLCGGGESGGRRDEEAAAVGDKGGTQELAIWTR